MKRNVYQMGDATYAFSSGSFDALLGHGSVGASKMRELSHVVNVSVSSIKDWRSGAHVPSDIAKVRDVAGWLGVETCQLLIKMGDESMEEHLTERQLDVLCDLWAQAFDFLELAKETDYFVWSDYDLDRIPPSLHRDAVVVEDASVDGEPNSILSLGLHEQVLNAYSRSLRRAYPVVGNTREPMLPCKSSRARFSMACATTRRASGFPTPICSTTPSLRDTLLPWWPRPARGAGCSTNWACNCLPIARGLSKRRRACLMGVVGEHGGLWMRRQSRRF